MTETPEHPAETTSEIVTAAPQRTAEPALVEQKPNRLYQIAAWVAIVAGAVFIVAVIFFSGFALGKHSGGPGHFEGRHHGAMMIERGGPPMRPGFGGPGNYGPGQGFGPGPGNFGQEGPAGPGGPSGPGQQAPTTAPTR